MRCHGGHIRCWVAAPCRFNAPGSPKTRPRTKLRPEKLRPDARGQKLVRRGVQDQSLEGCHAFLVARPNHRHGSSCTWHRSRVGSCWTWPLPRLDYRNHYDRCEVAILAATLPEVWIPRAMSPKCHVPPLGCVYSYLCHKLPDISAPQKQIRLDILYMICQN